MNQCPPDKGLLVFLTPIDWLFSSANMEDFSLELHTYMSNFSRGTPHVFVEFGCWCSARIVKNVSIYKLISVDTCSTYWWKFKLKSSASLYTIFPRFLVSCFHVSHSHILLSPCSLVLCSLDCKKDSTEGHLLFYYIRLWCVW